MTPVDVTGSFGWVAYDHKTEPNPRLMQLAAHEAGRRGPDAHGWAITATPPALTANTVTHRATLLPWPSSTRRIGISGHPPSAALTMTAACSETPWALAVLDSDGSVWVSRHGLPLHMMRTRTGVYLSSGSLPGSEPVAEHYTLQLARPDVDDPTRMNEGMFRAPR